MAMLLQISCTEELTDGQLNGWDEDYEYTPEEKEEEEDVPQEENPDYVYPETVTITCEEQTDLDEDTAMRILSLEAYDSTKLGYEYTTLSDSGDSVAALDIDKWTWSSSDDTVLNIDVYGTITGFTEGLVKVKITYAGSEQRVVADSMLVNVSFVRAQSVEISSVTGLNSVYEGYELQLSAKISPDNISFPEAALEWSTSNDLVAKVDENGLVYAYSQEEKAEIKAEKEAAGESTEGIDDLTVSIFAKPTDGADTEVVFGQFDVIIDPINANAGVIINTTTEKYCFNTTDGFQIDYMLIDPDDDKSSITWTSNNASAATVDNSGYVTIKGYGDVVISAMHVDAAEAQTYSFSVPAGWWIEEYDSYASSTEYTNNSSTTVYGHALFASASNNKNLFTGEGYLQVTPISGNYKTGQSTTVTIDEVSHTLTSYVRTDIWGLNEATTVLNANTYPILVLHIEDNVASDNGVLYQTFNINFMNASGSSYFSTTVKSTDDYSSDSRSTAKFFTDGSLMIVYNLSLVSNSYALGDLEATSDSYMTSTSMSWNYFMYGYTNETTVSGVPYDALSTNFNYKIYSVQTFASLTDLNTYIFEKGLTEK
ncbi:MAG: Ig-like domain-containing protein [Rikenellaceae bacterium]